MILNNQKTNNMNKTTESLTHKNVRPTSNNSYSWQRSQSAKKVSDIM